MIVDAMDHAATFFQTVVPAPIICSQPAVCRPHGRCFTRLSVGLAVLAAAAGPASCQPADMAAKGEAIFLKRCVKCHGDKGQGLSAAVGIAGPSIQAVHDPGAVMMAMEVGPSHMPSFADTLSVQEMQEVAAYVAQHLAVIPLGGGDIGEGGKLFRQYCAPCHRTAVRGGALAYTGLNAPELVDKSAAIIAGAIRWGPGAMPSFPPSVLDAHQVASIVEYVKFVQHPPSPGGSPMHWYGPVAEGFAAWIMLFASVALVGWIERGAKG